MRELVEGSSHRILERLRRGEVSRENAAGPAPDLIDERLLGRLPLDVTLDEREDVAACLGLSVLLVGG